MKFADNHSEVIDKTLPNYFHFINAAVSSAPSRQNLFHFAQPHPRCTDGLQFPILWTVIFLSALALPVCGQEFVPEHVVFPITDFKPDILHLAPLSMKFGTGFCLDPDCRFVGTNYHVAKMMGKHVRIKGVASAHLYLDSDPDDVGADAQHLIGGGSMRYTSAHDLAIYEMEHPLKNFHGIRFDADELDDNLEVDIYAYPFDWNPKRGLVHWHGRFIGKTLQGLLAFSYEGGGLRGGASGGIVVDSTTKKIVGVLNASGEGEDLVALAVPIQELSDFVTRAAPYVQATLFPKAVFVSPVAADLYPPYAWSSAEILLQRRVESAEVINLRSAAQNLAASMRNFTATEIFNWGHGNREPDATGEYETLIVGGEQRWRREGDKKWNDRAPFPRLNGWVTPGDDWSGLPEMVATVYNLRIHQAPDAITGGRSVHVFQYEANSEDRACGFDSGWSYMLLPLTRTKFYDCHGEVWLDEAGMILRISETMNLSGQWGHALRVVNYGSLERDGARYFVPVTFVTEAGNKTGYWCRGRFTDYGMFGVKVRWVTATESEQTRSAVTAR